MEEKVSGKNAIKEIISHRIYRIIKQALALFKNRVKTILEGYFNSLYVNDELSVLYT